MASESPLPIIAFLIAALLCSCHSTTKQPSLPAVHKDSLSPNGHKDSLPIVHKPVFGYRFTITGDFNGDGVKEKLMEHYYSGVENRETYKFDEGLTEYDQLVEAAEKKKPISFVLSDNKKIDTLHIASSPQLFGLSYLKNEGDLNGDGTDEVSYVVNWADWSNLNTWNIVTYKKGHWEELYSFSIWDWQLPDLPGTFNDYGLFGLQNKVINKEKDSINKRAEKDLAEFKGLVKKVGPNKIRIIYMNDDSDVDTTVINLKHHKIHQ